jgi:hypothetical protein
LKINVDQGGDDHAAERADAGQRPARPGRELPVEHLALDLEPHEKEKQRHEPVIDPVQDAEAEHVDLQRREIALRERGVGDQKGENRDAHQHDAARGFRPQEGAERGGRAAAGVGGPIRHAGLELGKRRDRQAPAKAKRPSARKVALASASLCRMAGPRPLA